MNKQANEVLTTGNVAKLLDINFRTVIRWIERGLLPAYRLPGRGDYRIQPADLKKFLINNAMPIPESLQDPVKKALIVDDEPAMANAIARALKRAGFETHIASGGFEAGMLINTEKPGLMTLDLHMPGMDGFAVLKLLKEKSPDPSLRILMVTGDPQGAEAARKHGAHGAITKPFTQEELLEAVNAILIN